MEKKVAIRADGSQKIGLGHLVRCIALAHMLREEHKIIFFSKEIPAGIVRTIREEGWQVKRINREEAYIGSLSEETIAVLDGYHFDSNFQKRVKSAAAGLMVIDDLQNDYNYADIVINHAPGITREDYRGETYVNYLLGPDYALLRPVFLKQDGLNSEQKDAVQLSVVICFGGSDAQNVTARIIDWLPDKMNNVTVITGSAYRQMKELKHSIEQRPDLVIRILSDLNAEEMCQELTRADLGIVPASGILFEAIAMRLPVISGYYTENQECIYSGFFKEEVIFGAESFQETAFKRAILEVNNSKLKEMKKRQANVIDGKSPIRIKREVEKLW